MSVEILQPTTKRGQKNHVESNITPKAHGETLKLIAETGKERKGKQKDGHKALMKESTGPHPQS